MTRRALIFPLVLAVMAFVPLRAHADNDAVQFGSDITVAPDAQIHDAVCFFCSAHIDGEVKGDVVVFFGGVHINGKADRDVVNFFGGTRLAANATVGRDLVNFFGSVHAGENAQVGRSLVIMFGNLRAPASFSIGKDRFIQPGWVFWTPMLLFVSFIILIVYAIRDWHRRRMYAYPYPPHIPPH